MQRLSGIGVSGGVGAGRAVVLIQRAQVLRFSISPVANRCRNRQARGRAAALDGAARSHSTSAARQRFGHAVRGAAAHGRRPHAGAASGIDCQRAARERRMGAAAGVRSPRGDLRRRRRSVPARAQRGSRRRGRPPAHESHAGRYRIPRRAGRVRGALRPRGRRAAPIHRGPARLEQIRGVHHRRRQPHVSHGDPRPVAPRARGRGAARCDRPNPARHADPRRRRRGHGLDRSAARRRSHTRCDVGATPHGRKWHRRARLPLER